VLTELKNRGVADVCIAVCDGLKGLPEAISTVWERTVVQTCVIHLLRNTFRYASRKYWDEMARDLRPIYTAPSEAAAAERFDEFADKWGAQYPAIIRLWRNAWSEFIPFLDYGACCEIGASRELIFFVGEDAGCGAFLPSRAAGSGVLVAAGHARVAA
jgi:putative transposase